MIRKEKVERAKLRLVKAVRSNVRLRHSIAADEELNDVLPRLCANFDAAVLRGEVPDDALIEELAVRALR